jgi:hypothetical protein
MGSGRVNELQRMDADTAETPAGVVRLLRRAAELVWAAADEARNVLPDAIAVQGPVPVGDEPAGLLRSAEQLLRRIDTPGASAAVHGLRARVGDLVWEANTGVDA